MKLRDYYKEIVHLNDTETGGWAPAYYGVFSKVINENNYKIIAEVGIGCGTHAKQILKNTNIDKLFLIDPMKMYDPNDLFVSNIMSKTPEIPGENFNELFNLINEELSPWKNKYTWHRCESTKVTNEMIPDEYLDCVFIDADHSYNAVLEDLHFWWNKVKLNGQLLGDDYYMPQVARAVHDFCKEKNINLEFLEKNNTKYKIYRIYKE
jgi:hypothetical protein